MTAESRPNLFASIWSVSRDQVSRVLLVSPAGMVKTSRDPDSNWAATSFAYSGWIFESVMSAYRWAGARSRTYAPTRDNRPVPMRIGYSPTRISRGLDETVP